MDREDLRLLRQVLEDSERVDERRIDLAAEGDRVVLRGAVATPEEASAAQLLLEQQAPGVVNRLRIDSGLREGRSDDRPVERVTPPDGEILVGDTDPLAGPDAAARSGVEDLGEAFSENEPWSPPDEPVEVPTAEEQRTAPSPGDGLAGEEAPAEPGGWAAGDLTRRDLDAAGRAPSIAPDASDALVPPTPTGVDDAGARPPGGTEPPPTVLPQATAGIGATGEGTAGGGSISGTPAAETGAAGADTEEADPARTGTGATAEGTGTGRGPEAVDDPGVRGPHPRKEKGGST